MRRFLALFGVFLILICGAIALLTPTIALFKEGYPTATWPAGGHFASIQNIIREPLPPSTGIAPTQKLLEIFENSKGRAILVLKQGAPVVEHYADGYSRDTAFNSFSMVKGLVGVLTLKALDEGRISSFNAPLKNVLSKAYPDFTSLDVGKVTIAQLLDMRSGLMFEASSTTQKEPQSKSAQKINLNPFSNLAKLHAYGLQEQLEGLKVADNKVGTFAYQNINTALLGLVLETIYEKPLPQLLNEKIWHPAGAKGFQWRQYPTTDRVSAYCCLYASIADWARVGQYLLTNGLLINGWGKPFLNGRIKDHFFGSDSPFYETRTVSYRSQIRYDILDREGEKLYGFFKYFLGQGGQILYLVPHENLVVVRFGEKHQLLHSTLYEIHRALLKAETAQ